MGLFALLKRKNNKALFTTPSHGGRFYISHKYYNWYKSDISETDTYNPVKVLKESQNRAAKIYGTKYTKYLTNGSTSGVIAAIISSGAKKVLIWENSHICHKNGCRLAGAQIIEYELPYDSELGVYRAITPENVSNLLDSNKADAIVITSPTYEGFVSDTAKISEVCKSRDVKLIVDEAHGALYPFSDELPVSAVRYADYTVQSLHKTAGGLNPTALLHSNDKDPSEALSLINTTSPSYPMLATIEANISYLNSNKGRKAVKDLISNIKSLNLKSYNDDITKIILKKDDISGFALSEILYKKYGIEDERTNEKSTMLLCGLGTDIKKLERLRKAVRKEGLCPENLK